MLLLMYLDLSVLCIHSCSAAAYSLHVRVLAL